MPPSEADSEGMPGARVEVAMKGGGEAPKAPRPRRRRRVEEMRNGEGVFPSQRGFLSPAD